MGGSLRTCKEKFYGAVHDGLRTWCVAAKADGWAYKDVREGLPRESPKKKVLKEAPKLNVKVEIGGGNGEAKKGGEGGDGWL
jgi:hypothetical protein